GRGGKSLSTTAADRPASGGVGEDYIRQQLGLNRTKRESHDSPYTYHEDDFSQEQTESEHASKGNEDGEDDEDGEGDNEDEEDDEDREDDNEDGEGDNEDGEDETNDDDDTNEKTTTADDKTEEENDENVRSTPSKASSSGRDPCTTSTEIVVKNIRFENYNLKMLMDVHGDLEGHIV
ncbi:hypothetical protein HAX54_034311, partial [Datura stramonium]|nr:hypothetical protein [Datura stramonium]